MENQNVRVFKMEQRANFLALCLLDAMEDEDPKMIEAILTRYDVNPNFLVQDRGIAPIHYSCGMPNVELSERLTAKLLEHGADPNVPTKDNFTPMHVAAIHGRANIVKMLLDNGGRLDAVDDYRKTPILYAIDECHFDVIKLAQDHIFEHKYQEQKKIENNHLTVNKVEDKKYTPNRINYNYDVTSPYYINITHRRKPAPCTCCNHKPPNLDNPNPTGNERKENIFALTKENLGQLSNEVSDTQGNSRVSLIEIWREKIRRCKSRQSIVKQFTDIDELLSGIMTNDELDFTNTQLIEKSQSENPPEEETTRFGRTVFGRVMRTLEEAPTENDDTFYTVSENPPDEANDSNFIRSPKVSEYIIQMTEAYVHTDDENGLIFYETKLLNNQAREDRDTEERDAELNGTVRSTTTNFTIPLDYETDALRAELTNFGDPPGPITKTTKKLYIKRLTKYKRNPLLIKAKLDADDKKRTTFSVELHRTIRRKEYFNQITDYIKYEQDMIKHFQSNINIKRHREGTAKQSFIYLLIDPRISHNLPGESLFMPKFDIWKTFVSSIFYVGKGKSSRPFSHLYEAMKLFTKTQSTKQEKSSILKPNPTLVEFKSPAKKNDNKKLNRIIEIWSDSKGVVCVHTFHNITPEEAYTREAAMIDALGLEHLTNVKRGDYYGLPQTWPMRIKKYMGIALLFKAMKMYLAEGESQISPSDLF